MKKRVLSVMIVLVMLVSFSSCEITDHTTVTQQKHDTGISFSWWGNDMRSKYTVESIKAFENKNDVVVRPSYCELSGYKSWLDAKMISDEIPDVMQINYNWLHEYNAQGYEFYDLESLKDEIQLDNYTRQQLELGRVNGKLQGIPISLNGVNFFYNENTLKKYGIPLPSTWDDIFLAAQKLKKEGVYVLEMREKVFWLCCVAYAEQITGKPLFDSSDRMQYNEQEFKIMLEFGKRLLDSGAAPRPDRFRHTDFFSGETAGLACWISDAKSYFSDNSGVNAQSVNISLGDLITVSKGRSLGWYKKPMALYCMSRDTKEPKKVAKFVDHLLNSEEMAKLQGTEKGIPLSKSALEVLESRDMLSDLQAVADRKMNSDTSIKVMSWHLENESFFKLFLSKCYDVTYNGSDPAEKSEEFVKEIRSIEVLFK